MQHPELRSICQPSLCYAPTPATSQLSKLQHGQTALGQSHRPTNQPPKRTPLPPQASPLYSAQYSLLILLYRMGFPGSRLTCPEAALQGWSLEQGMGRRCHRQAWRGTSRAGKQRSRASSSARGRRGTAPERAEQTAIRMQSSVPTRPRCFAVRVCSWEALLHLQITLQASGQLWHFSSAALGYIIIFSFREGG